MDEIDALIAEAELGEEARKFLEGDLGRCLIGMAQQDAKEAQEKLVEVDPDDKAKIRELQNRALFGIRFQDYLAELVSRGNNAMDVFKQQISE
jgi:hypothetical protein